MERHNQPSGTLSDLEGQVRLESVQQGSKSHHRRPVLVLDDGSYAIVSVEGDSYFEATTLKNLIGQRVRLSGRWDNLILCVEAAAIEALDGGAPTEKGLDASQGLDETSATSPEGGANPLADPFTPNTKRADD